VIDLVSQANSLCCTTESTPADLAVRFTKIATHATLKTSIKAIPSAVLANFSITLWVSNRKKRPDRNPRKKMEILTTQMTMDGSVS